MEAYRDTSTSWTNLYPMPSICFSFIKERYDFSPISNKIVIKGALKPSRRKKSLNLLDTHFEKLEVC